jgi:hypothetical protein
MTFRAALFLTAALACAAPAPAADAPAAYDAKAAPLDDLSRQLLSGNGYELRDDGTVWDKIADAPVAARDMDYLLSRLASARRLRALLEINNIINRYDAERSITSEDREAVRALVRDNWVVFGFVPRRDFRSYFSAEELDALDKIPPRFEAMTPLTMHDPESVTAEAPGLVSASSGPAVAVSSAPAVPAPPVPALTPLMSPPSLKRESPFAATAAPAGPGAAAAPATRVAPAVFTTSPAPPPPAPPPARVVAAPAAPSTSAVVAADLGTLKPWTPPAVPKAATASSAPALSPPAAAPAAPPAPEPPKPAAVDAAEYEKFVAEGPYTKDGKALLALLGGRAPDFCLPLLRRTVVGAIPQIAVDGARTGRWLRAGYARDAADPQAPPVVALSPGPVFVAVKTGLFGSRADVLIPEAPEAWAELGLPRPPLAALRGGVSPAGTENGPWGSTRVFDDGSRRGAYSAEEQAGELLEQLLLLGLAREGLDASPYAARRWARTARLMLSLRLKEELQQDSFLDPDRRAELRDWLDHPDEADDVSAAFWSGSRSSVLDPRRGPPDAAREFEAAARANCARAALEDALVEAARRRAAAVGALESLAGAGVVSAADAKAAARAAADAETASRRTLLASPPPCAAADPARDAGLRRAELLLAEASRAERLLREGRAGIQPHGD